MTEAPPPTPSTLLLKREIKHQDSVSNRKQKIKSIIKTVNCNPQVINRFSLISWSAVDPTHLSFSHQLEVEMGDGGRTWGGVTLRQRAPLEAEASLWRAEMPGGGARALAGLAVASCHSRSHRHRSLGIGPGVHAHTQGERETHTLGFSF